ncbi:CheR family methyltransferase [Massilia sp. LXY-6]|uniref:CheR family methyltransferase n=1 Tax=Massilia sp. LXY-6 TaxID=3379823 RepID=UPI003EE21864
MRWSEHPMPAAAWLDQAARRIAAEIGLDFSGAKRRQFHTALVKMAAALGYPSPQECAAWLLEGRWTETRSVLCARFFTIGETYFFREPRALDLVCDHARARIVQDLARPLRVWSAGCCTAEEPYSIAMALRRRVPQLAPDRVSILATDLNDAFLDVARAGAYRRWSFRRTDPADLAAFFRLRHDGRYEIDASLREQIRFARLNLASGAYPSAATQTQAMDVIFCRNVLMYFGRAQIMQVTARLRDSLVDGGWLVVNASEASPELFPGFTPVRYGEAVFFRKNAGTAAGAGPSVAAARGARLPAACAAGRKRAAPVLPAPLPAQEHAPQAQGQAQAQEEVMARVRTLAGAGAREDALQCLRRAVEAHPLSAPLQQSAALFALEYGDRQMARQGVRRLLYLDPDSAIGHYLSALIEDAEGRRELAMRLLHDSRRLAAGADAELSDAVDQWLGRIQ